MKTNEFDAICEDCGHIVKPTEGRFRKVGRRWAVVHFKCKEPRTAPKFTPAGKAKQ